MKAHGQMHARIGLTAYCILAVAGGLVFNALSLPAPWLAGAMVTTAAAALCGLRADVPGWTRNAVFVVLGLQIGSGFTQASIAGLAAWPLSLMVLAVTVLAVLIAGMWFYHRVCRWDASTAFYASAPGALSMVMAMADDNGADTAKVAIVQCMRLFLLVAFLPLAVSVSNSGAIVPVAAAQAAGPAALTAICLVGAIAGYLANRLGVPAGYLMGAMSANAVLHVGDIISGSMPGWLLIPAFILLGVMVGLRFQAIGRQLLKRLLGVGLAGFAVSLVVAAAGAVFAAGVTGFPVLVTLLAFAPGGLEVMTILAFALGLNPAFVAAHQLARYLGLSLALPVLSSIVNRNREKPK